MDPDDYVWFSCTSCAQAPYARYLFDGARYVARIWFTAYLEKVGSILTEAPGIDIENHDLNYRVLETAARCSVCRIDAFEQFPLWVRTCLKPQIAEAIDKVELNFCIICYRCTTSLVKSICHS